jgi:CRP/FNR family cyclic AMP-dependent transcriptional regulator
LIQARFQATLVCVGRRQGTEHHMQNRELDFRVFAREACPVIDVQAGTAVFQLGEPGATMYVILSGRIDMVNGDRVIESLGAQEAFGMMSLIDALPRTATAQVTEDAQLAVIDRKKYQFMLHELPSFAIFLIQTLANRVRSTARAL